MPLPLSLQGVQSLQDRRASFNTHMASDVRFSRFLYSFEQRCTAVCRWLRKDKEVRLQEQRSQDSEKGSAQKAPPAAIWSNGWAAGRMTSSMKDSSNAVMRM